MHMHGVDGGAAVPALEQAVGGSEAEGAWSYSGAFARDVDVRYNPGLIASALRALASENSDFDEIVAAFSEERRDLSWFFDAAERTRATQLAKTPAGCETLRGIYRERGFELGRIASALDVGPFGEYEFAAAWPLLPYQVEHLCEMVAGLAGADGPMLMYRGGRGCKIVADHAVARLRGAAPTALAPAWMLYDAAAPGREISAAVYGCEEAAEGGVLDVTAYDVRVLKALAAAPYLTGIPAGPTVVAALNADDVGYALEAEAERTAASLERLVELGVAREAGGSYSFVPADRAADIARGCAGLSFGGRPIPPEWFDSARAARMIG